MQVIKLSIRFTTKTMWQRIQTLFLVMIIASMLGLLILPIWVNAPDTPNEHQLYALHYTEKSPEGNKSYYLPYCLTAILAVAAATVSFISIRSYHDRQKQMRLGLLNSLLMLGVMICIVFFVTDLTETHPDAQYGFGFWLVAVGVACNFLANRFIRRDEQLVKDADRIR